LNTQSTRCIRIDPTEYQQKNTKGMYQLVEN
jgi:hypothetical protein